MSKVVVDSIFAKQHPKIAARVQAEFLVAQQLLKQGQAVKISTACEMLGIKEGRLLGYCKRNKIKVYRIRFVDEDGSEKTVQRCIKLSDLSAIKVLEQKNHEMVTLVDALEILKKDGLTISKSSAIKAIKKLGIGRISRKVYDRYTVRAWIVDFEAFREYVENDYTAKK